MREDYEAGLFLTIVNYIRTKDLDIDRLPVSFTASDRSAKAAGAPRGLAATRAETPVQGGSARARVVRLG
jgi:hypothetical protein